MKASACLQKPFLISKQHKQMWEHIKSTIFSEKAPKPIGPYNQAVVRGKFIFVSGQLAIDPKERKIVVNNITLQTRQVMKNIGAILEVAGYSLKDIVQSAVYLTSKDLFSEF
jgi:2-iminobutanoate/2-iminopropanoate deaminase